LLKQFLFTEDHRWPVRTQRGLAKTVAGSQLNSNTLIPQKGEFLGQESVLNPRLAAILGWLITDGSALWSGRGWGAYVGQSEKKHLLEIASLLGTKPRPVGTKGAGVYCVPVAKADRDILRAVCPYREMLLAVVGRLSRAAAEAMWEAMFKAEGSTAAADGQQTFTQYPERNRIVIDAFQILSIMTGRVANINTTDRFCCTISKNGRPLSPYKAGGIARRPYHGAVWCPTTPSGTWVVRHNGHVLMTGNSMPGMRRRQILYNYDNAKQYSFVVVVEGPTDAHRVGGPCVALLGKSISAPQREMLIKTWVGKPILFMLDPEAHEEMQGLVYEIAMERRTAPVIGITLPEGADPGEWDTAALWNYIYAQAAAQRVTLR